MTKVSNFEDMAYWNERYKQPKAKDAFDWYLVSFAMISGHLSSALRHLVSCGAVSDIGIVDVGCGNSGMLSDMSRDANFTALVGSLVLGNGSAGYSCPLFVGVDYSPAAIARQREALQGVERAELHVADVRDMRAVIRDSSAACVVDKATLDCIDCTGQAEDAVDVVREVHRVLVRGGAFVVVTCRPVPRRLETILAVEGLSVVSVVSLENDPVSPSHVIVVNKT
jgi:SAM-dependent methyltransferase